MEDALELVRAALPATIDIRRDFAADVPPLVGDAAQIHQVVVNLATNASHAIGMRPGHVEFRIAAVDVDAGTERASPDLRGGRYVRLSVIDDGHGMDRATLERIFDPFFTTMPPGQGSGLGLSVAHGIVRSHGGAIRVESEPGKGTALHVFFPAIQVAVEATPAPTAGAVPTRGGRVLYVDDEGALVLMARRSLTRFGWDVTGFTDPAKALQEFQLRPGEFDVVVTDAAMPGMTGLELAARLRATRPDVPIVLASGNLGPEDQDACERLGVRDLVQKPFAADELCRMLDRLRAR
jgi:CheY-like chemotaxis protein